MMNSQKRSFFNKESVAFMISSAIILIYLSPLYYLGENAHIRVHDNLDSNIAWYSILTNSGQLFGPLNASIPQLLNGLSRNVFGTEFSAIVWLHALFPSMLAYAISQTLTRAVAFVGMYLLLKKHFIKEPEACYIPIGVSLAFALTPFWPSGMLSTLGMPLALWAFLNIRNRTSTWKDWLVLILLPFYSSFILGFFFFLTAMGLFWLYDLLTKRCWNPVFLGSIAFMTALYLAIEYRLVLSLIIGEAPTSRNEFVSSRLDLSQTLRLVVKNFNLGHNHVQTLHTQVILPVLLLAFLFILIHQQKKKEKRFIFLFVLNIVLSVWYAFWFYKGWQPLKEAYPLLNTFNFARFHFMRPLVIYVCFALALWFLWRLGTKWKKLVLLCLVLQICITLSSNEEIVYRAAGTPSFKQFYAVSLFTEIKDYIGKPQSSYRIASIGLHPAVAQYNGFYTLDTYNNFYPLSYKRQFRKIIAKELAKNARLRRYFDTWGNRVYLFAAELGKRYDFGKHTTRRINHLELNTAAFKQLGGKYILSSVPIMNAAENHLLFMRLFDSAESAWRVYLYKVG